MTLEQFLEKIDHLTPDELAQVKTHISGREESDNTGTLFGTPPKLDDISGMFGSIKASVSDSNAHHHP